MSGVNSPTRFYEEPEEKEGVPQQPWSPVWRHPAHQAASLFGNSRSKALFNEKYNVPNPINDDLRAGVPFGTAVHMTYLLAVPPFAE